MKATALRFLAIGSVLLAMLFLAFQPKAPAPAHAPTQAAFGAAPAVARTVELVIHEGKLQSGPPVIKLQQGEQLALRVTSDRADELHLHGYDLVLKLEPGVVAELRFRATRSGRFEYELHHAHADLGALEVQPR